MGTLTIPPTFRIPQHPDTSFALIDRLTRAVRWMSFKGIERADHEPHDIAIRKAYRRKIDKEQELYGVWP